LLCLLCPYPQPGLAEGADLFVTEDGGETSCSQASPCTLEAAMDQAIKGDSIYIAEGTYTYSGAPKAVINIVQSLNFYGGWNGAPSGAIECDPILYPTILDGQSDRRVVYINGAIQVTLNGFTVTHGKQTLNNGAGLYSQDADLTFDSMIFDSNVIYADEMDYAYGGGAYVEGGSISVRGCTFKENTASATKSAKGGGLAIFNTSAASVENSLFEDNVAWNSSGLHFVNDSASYVPLTLCDCIFHHNGWPLMGSSAMSGYAGAIDVSGAEACIEGNTFSKNRSANNYGAICIFDSDLLFARNTISGNHSYRTSGIDIKSSPNPIIINNVIADNDSSNSKTGYPAIMVQSSTGGQLLHNTIGRNIGAYGIQLLDSASATLTDNILVGHTTALSVDSGSSATMEATLWGSGDWANDTDWAGTGTIDTGTIEIWANPNFIDPDSGDYHIAPGSPAINAGVDAGITIDIDEDARPFGSGFDIGADENDIVVLSPVLPLLLED